MRWMKNMMMTAIGVAALSGCASDAGQGDIDWQHGARRAWVGAVYSPDLTATMRPACLAKLSASDYAARRFVEVQYYRGRSAHYEVAELTPGLSAKNGDRIELWPERCEEGKLSVISKVFPS